MNSSKPKIRSKKFIFKTDIKMEENSSQGLIEAVGKPPIKLSSPPEFGGKPGIWSPEDLLVASVNSCLMTTFSYYAAKRRLVVESYESSAEGTVELIDIQFVFTEIIVRPKILVKEKKDIKVVEKLLEISKKGCLISNSLESDISLEPEIKTAG